MKTSLLLMTKADHHRAALKESLRTNKFPKGLTVHIQPHILEPDAVVLAEWSTAHTDFTRTLIQTLIRHYEKLVKIEREKQDSQRKQMLERIEQTQLSTKDAEYLNRLWKEETATAFADAKKYAAEKAEQRKIAAERLKMKERSKPSTPKNPTDLHLRVEELQKELKRLQDNKAPQQQCQTRGSTYYRGRFRGRGRGRGY